MSETVLEKHNTQDFVFYSYYTPESATYYELRPFLKSMQFLKEKDIEDSIPSHFVKLVNDFQDEKFSVAKITDDTPFVTKFGIWHLLSLRNADKNLIRKFADSCFGKVEADRIRRVHAFTSDLKHKLETSVVKQNGLQEQLYKLKHENIEKHIEYDKSIKLIKETLMLLIDKHTSINENINKLVTTLKTK